MPTPHDQRKRKEYQRKINQMWLCLFGNGNPKAGMEWKMEQLMEFKGTIQRLTWIGVTGALSATALFFWKVVVALIEHKGL